MIVGVPKEIKLQEHRIGLTPESVKVLVERKHEVLVEKNGGLEAGFTNQDYFKAGATVATTNTVVPNISMSIMSSPCSPLLDGSLLGLFNLF